MRRIIRLIWVSLFLYACGSNPCKNCGCDNVEDCLSKHKFEEARKYASNYSQDQESNDEQKVKIIPVEALFWIEQKELKRAETVVSELPLLGHEYENSDHILHPLLLNIHVNKEYNDIMMQIVTKYCETGQVEESVLLIKRLPKKILINREKIDFNCPGMGVYGKENEFNMCCERAYDKYKGSKILKETEELSDKKDCCCFINIYSFTQKDAQEIIKQYQ